MLFTLTVLIHLAAMASISTPSSVQFEDRVNSVLMTRCAPDGRYFVERFKHFKNCEEPEGKTLSYAEQASPYVCLLSLNMAIEACTDKIPALWKRVSNGSEDVMCPLNYTVRVNYLSPEMDLPGGARFFGDKEKCFSVCNYSKQIAEDCTFMGRLSYVIDSHRRELNVNTSSARKASEGEAENRRLNVTSAEQVSSLPGKGSSSVKAPFKSVQVTQTTVECETKTNDVGRSNTEVKSPADNGSLSSNSVPISNNTISSRKGSASGDLHQSELSEKNSQKKEDEPGVKEVKSVPNTERAQVQRVSGDVETSPVFHEANEHVTDDNKKDFVYDSQQKLGEDDGDDLDEVPEKAELQESFPGRDSEFSPKRFHAKDLGNGDNFFQSEDSHFSTYFFMTISIVVILYVLYRNKNKIVAYALEGRRSKNGRRRPLSASYRKLDCNLEEAIASNPSHASMTSVVY